MTNCGPLGWVTDEAGYRYQSLHPHTGRPWPAMPRIVLDAWEALAGYRTLPKAASSTTTGRQPGWGCTGPRRTRVRRTRGLALARRYCLFRIGGTKRNDPACTVRLASGDAVVLGGEARLASTASTGSFPASSLLPEGGRINLTLGG